MSLSTFNCCGDCVLLGKFCITCLPTPMSDNTYLISAATIKEPPATFWERLQFLGPGFILSASIVGSGELIATTTLGASAGFTAFWIIIASCLIKVAVQLEFGKHTIVTGETAMEAFKKLPGPAGGRGKWSVVTILCLMSLKVFQIGGMVGGSALVLHMLVPAVPTMAWVMTVAALVAAIIFKGYYLPVEKASLVMTVLFTLLTIACLVFLSGTAYSISLADIWSGLQFDLSPQLIVVAIGAFGITGVASDEILAYTYWCREKGYAAYSGPKDDSADWLRRADGWRKVMYLDAIVAMIIYTSVTAAFYLLGAAVLHQNGHVPEGLKMVETIATIYTESLGPAFQSVFLIGAFFVLFSSVFATLAFWTRLFSDIFGQLGWIDFFNVSARQKTIALLAWVIPATWALAFFFVESPVLMILSGGVVGSILLLLVAFAALHFKYKRAQPLPSGNFYNVALWVSTVSIAGIAIYGLIKLLAP